MKMTLLQWCTGMVCTSILSLPLMAQPAGNAATAPETRAENVIDETPATHIPAPLPHAHAHNDYLHARPLFDALRLGFTSVEADVFLVDGQLLVAHSTDQLSSARTLENLYLQPLADIAAQNEGRVFPEGQPLTLLVDIKSNGTEVWTALNRLLEKYDPIISQTRDDHFDARAVVVVISGDRPVDSILAAEPRRAGIDGRLSDLDSHQPAHVMPLISDNWTRHFQFRGTGEFSEAEQHKLQDMVRQAHAKGRRLRFWATPEDPRLWQILLNADVDLIGTDRLTELSQFFRDAPAPGPAAR